MIKVMFVCHGNICRSPMAEYLFKDLVKKKKLDSTFYISSSATSSEEIGNPVYPNTKKILNSLGIDCSEKRAIKLLSDDYYKYDYFIGMDSYNISNINRILGKSDKTYRLLDFTILKRDIDDPWYSRDFKKCYNDITTGLEGFLKYLKLE